MAVDVTNPSINGTVTTPRTASSSGSGSASVSSPGPGGRSAYELALAEGFVGTLEEWIASLEGDQGIQGIQGPEGTLPEIVDLTLIYENGLI